MGFIDPEGYFTLTGRQSRFYIMSSLNKVYCDRVQNFITKFHFVDECAVVKVPDDDMLYVNKAYVVLKKGIQRDEQTINNIINLCKQPIIEDGNTFEQLKPYEVPTYIEFVDQLPRRKGTEKIDYPMLEENAKVKKLKR